MGHWGKREDNGLWFVATQPCVRALWENFIQHLHLPLTVLCASSTKNIVPFCLYENQIDFCQWKYSLRYWWTERQVCCSDHLPKSTWNLELSRESAREAISDIFICIFQTYFLKRAEGIYIGVLAVGKYVKKTLSLNYVKITTKRW